jgi:O-antigen/teichoic acid export membrane protein
MKPSHPQANLTLHRKVIDSFFNKLAHASAWMFLGTVMGGTLGYVFQVLMGRMLSTQEYGLFSAMMALYAVLAAPLGTLVMVISRKVSEYRAKQDTGSITHFYFSVNVKSAVVGGLVLGVGVFFVPHIQSYLKAPDAIPVYLFGTLLFFTFFPIINNAFLQGLQNFTWLASTTSLGFVLKIIFSGALVWLGFGVAGAMGGLILAGLASGLITYGALHTALSEGRDKPYQTAHLSFKPALPVFVANLAFVAMTQLDMVMVNYYFPAHEAGLYAAASVLGKAVMYLPGGISVALFPMVAENHSRNEGSTHLFLQAIGLTAILCGAGAIFYFLFGEEIIKLLYGENYRGAGEVLKYFGIAIFPMGMVFVAENFLIAKGRVLFAYLFAFTAPFQLTAIYFFHDSLQMVITVMGVSGLFLAILGYGFLWRDFKSPQV